MPFARDSLSTLIEKTLADIQARLAGANPWLRRGFLNVMGRVLAAQHNDQLGYIDWVSKMAIPVTAEGEFIDAWAALRGLTRKAPSAAAGTASIVGGIPSSPISAGTELTKIENGSTVTYTVTTGITLDPAGTGTLELQSTAVGAISNADAGTPLRFVSPPAGVPETASVITMTGGTDLEDDATFRARMLKAYAAPPQGGDLADYENWALAVPGVTRAWAGGSSISGAGSVTVFFMMDDDAHNGGSPPGHGIPIGTDGVSQYETRDTPATGDQLAVADYIFDKRPVTALVYAFSPIPVPLNIIVGEVPVDDDIRGGIADAVEGFILREASPGGVTLPDLSPGGVLDLSHLWDAISAVPGLDHFILVSPTSDIVVAAGQISVPGTIVFE